MLRKSARILEGLKFWLQGLGWAARKDLRAFILIPLFLNILFWILLIYFGIQYFNNNVWLGLPSWWPEFLDPISDWVFNFLFGLVFVLLTPLLVTGFAILANIIAAPFNGLLSEMVLNRVQSDRINQPLTVKYLWDMMIRTLIREARKFMYYFPRLLLIVVLMLIPGVNLLAPFVWVLFGAWMAAIQYLDFPADNQGLDFETTLKRVRSEIPSALGLGFVVLTVSLVPFLNFIVIPVTVIAATLLWNHRFERPVISEAQSHNLT